MSFTTLSPVDGVFNLVDIPSSPGGGGWYRLKAVTNYGYGVITVVTLSSSGHGRLRFFYRAHVTNNEYTLVQLEYLPAETAIKLNRVRLMKSGSDVYLEVFFGDYDTGSWDATSILSDVIDGVALNDPLVASDNTGELQAELMFNLGFRVYGRDTFKVGDEERIFTLPSATANVAEFVGGGGNYTSLQDHAIKVYAYKEYNGDKYFVETPIQSATHNTTQALERLDWSWSAVDNADGYRVVRYDEQHSYNYDYYQDVAGLTLNDDNTGWIASNPVPVTPNRFLHGIEIYSGKVNIGDVLNTFYDMQVWGSLNVKDLYIRGTKVTGEGEHNAILYSNNSVVTVENTAVATTLFDTGNGKGSNTIPSASIAAGQSLRLRGNGIISSKASTDTLRLLLQVGAATLFDSTARDLPASLSEAVFSFEIITRYESVGASGTGFTSGSFTVVPTDETTPRVYAAKNSAAVTIDTTGDPALVFTGQWGTADVANILKCQQLTLEYLPVQ